eukprot:359021-Chlamydomonas_euryale.AAC.2
MLFGGTVKQLVLLRSHGLCDGRQHLQQHGPARHALFAAVGVCCCAAAGSINADTSHLSHQPRAIRAAELLKAKAPVRVAVVVDVGAVECARRRQHILPRRRHHQPGALERGAAVVEVGHRAGDGRRVHLRGLRRWGVCGAAVVAAVGCARSGSSRCWIRAGDGHRVHLRGGGCRGGVCAVRRL